MANNTQPEPEESSSGNPGLAPLSIARTIWKRKVCILSTGILLSAGAVAIVRRLPAVYVAESLILVDSQKIPEKFVSATVATELEDRIAAIRQQILSSGELKKIIGDFDLYQKQRKTLFEEEILELMRKDVTIELVSAGAGTGAGAANTKRPGAFRIGYQGPDPRVVAMVANRLTDLYVEQNLKTRESQAEGTSEFLDTQLREAKTRLDQLEAAVSAYKLKHNGELPQQENSLASALAGLHTRLQANLDASNRAQQTKIVQESTLNAMEISAAQMSALRSVTRGTGAGMAVQGAPAPRKTSEALQERLDMLRITYTDKNPEVMNLRDAIATAKRTEEEKEARENSAKPVVAAAGDPPSAQPPASEPPELARTREQIAALRAQVRVSEAELVNRAAEQKDVLRQIDQYQSRIERLPVREQEMAQITRDYEMSKENYKSLLDKQTAAAMALDMERRQQSERFTVLDRATVPEKPLKPNRPLFYALGCLGSLAIGLLVGLIVELRKNVFLGEWELPEGTTVLARLPYIEVTMQSSGSAPKPRGKGVISKKELAAASSVVLLILPGLLTGALLSLFDRL
jgi:polysaccharide chain length determinant protein (PEP-CTERM system associated)